MSGLNGVRVQKIGPYKKGSRPTILVPLPRELWRPAGNCRCSSCAKPDGSAGESFWDTLATSEDSDHTWTVHAPYLQPGGMTP